jgi:hypothetical protein
MERPTPLRLEELEAAQTGNFSKRALRCRFVGVEEQVIYERFKLVVV